MRSLAGAIVVMGLFAAAGCQCDWRPHWRTQAQIQEAVAISHGGIPDPPYSTAPLVVPPSMITPPCNP